MLNFNKVLKIQRKDDRWKPTEYPCEFHSYNVNEISMVFQSTFNGCPLCVAVQYLIEMSHGLNVRAKIYVTFQWNFNTFSAHVPGPLHRAYQIKKYIIRISICSIFCTTQALAWCVVAFYAKLVHEVSTIMYYIVW